MTAPFTDITDQLERAARNGTRAHLAPDLVRALIESGAYPILLAERTKELTRQWHDRKPQAPPPPIESSSGPIGSNIGPRETTGPSAGTIPRLVHDAAERLASEEAQRLSRPRKRGQR